MSRSSTTPIMATRHTMVTQRNWKDVPSIGIIQLEIDTTKARTVKYLANVANSRLLSPGNLKNITVAENTWLSKSDNGNT